VTLTDAGPLIAIIDADEADHASCVDVLNQLTIPLVTTWPAFTEAMCLLARAGGIRAQQAVPEPLRECMTMQCPHCEIPDGRLNGWPRRSRGVTNK
jgi:predicted nucleic acid-binding protein